MTNTKIYLKQVGNKRNKTNSVAHEDIVIGFRFGVNQTKSCSRLEVDYELTSNWTLISDEELSTRISSITVQQIDN